MSQIHFFSIVKGAKNVCPKFNNRIRYHSHLSYVHNPGKSPLKPLTLGKVIEYAANKYENRPAIKFKATNQTLTFKEVLTLSDKLAAGFRKLGLKPKNKIGIWAPNVIEWYLTHMACARGGYILVNINPALQLQEIHPIINSIELDSIVCLQQFKDQNYYTHLRHICPKLFESHSASSENRSSLKSIVMGGNENLKGTYPFQQLINDASELEIREIQDFQDKIDPDDICHLQLTSGTTGTPKAPMQSHFQIVNNSYNTGERNELNQKHHTICVQVPFFHAFGTIITINAALNHGATLVIPNPGYNPNCSLDAIRDEKCTVIHGTPTMYLDLVNVQKERQEKIEPEIAVSGGAPCSPHLFSEIKNILKVKKVKSVYGLSETTAVAFQSQYDEDDHHSFCTVGYLGDHLEAKVIDSQGNMVPRGVPGELLLRGYSTTLGYWKNEGRTKEVMGFDNWLHTGDQFILEEDGYGRIVGRIKDIIIRGGENIFPKELEDIINTHPDVIDTQVVGVPHERLGEEVCAVVRIRKSSTFTLKDIHEHCKGKLANFKIPSRLEITDSFPKTASGKIKKYEIIESIVQRINQKAQNIN